MIDGYTVRNIAMFLFPVYGWLIYKGYRWHKLTPYIAWGVLAFVLWTLPWANYGHKPQLINRIIFIYHKDKIKETGMTYRMIPIKPAFWGGIHHTSIISNSDYNKVKSDDIVFRLLVWEDLWKELIQNKAWFGMGLSHPLRSPQIEMLDIATSEWKKDGWISAHNSYFYVIYRTGIIGFLAILWLFFKIYCSFMDFLEHKDLTGMILLLPLLYWSLEANWMLMFELPQNACFYWMLFGLIINRKEYDQKRMARIL